MKTKNKPKRLKNNNGLNYAILMACCGLLTFSVYIIVSAKKSESAQASQPVQLSSEDDMVLIPTPTRQIAQGEKLGSVEFAMIKWPKSRLNDAYIMDTTLYVESVALTPLPKFLPVPSTAISSEAIDRNAVVEAIPEGMRAITVKVDVESAVEGWAGSGNFVDVILLRSSQRSENGLEAKVIAENVKILSAGRSANPMSASDTAPRTPATVTLLTTQEDALKIKTASSVGRLTFSLRGRGDALPTNALGLNQKDLLGGSRTIANEEITTRGFATGPDGKTYVLHSDNRWEKSPHLPKSKESIISK
jgi:Flp pilus assembly protein CpaB